MEPDSPDILVVPTKVQSKFMMKHKGEEQVEEGSSPINVTRKQAPIKIKESQKMLQWMQMGSKE